MKFFLIVFFLNGHPQTWGQYDSIKDAEAEQTLLYHKYKNGLNREAYKRYTFSRSKTYNEFITNTKIEQK